MEPILLGQSLPSGYACQFSINDAGCFYPNLSNLLKEIFEISCKAVMLFVGHKMVTCVAETREMCRNNQGVKSMTKRSHDG